MFRAIFRSLRSRSFPVIKDFNFSILVTHYVHLIGLSALMTTTLVSMENTVKLLRENNVDCKIIVGGAVVTADYAEQIGADYYAKDAKESVDIARKFFGN